MATMRRILTTHVGSLIRPPELLQFIAAKQAAKPYDEAAYQACLARAVAEVVQRQAKAGIDLPSDGEFGKAISWSQYALERLSGFERRPAAPGGNPFQRGADRTRFADFYAELDRADGPPASAGAAPSIAVCTGPIEYTGQAEIRRDIANFKAALKAAGVEQGFLPVAAPASVIRTARTSTTRARMSASRRSRGRCAPSIAPSSTQGCCCSSTMRVSP
jgi:5-methyltetrahydropteroyltriglutamate--homocysteine methyltransferase